MPTLNGSRTVNFLSGGAAGLPPYCASAAGPNADSMSATTRAILQRMISSSGYPVKRLRRQKTILRSRYSIRPYMTRPSADTTMITAKTR